jgi:hypothetical protein
MIENPLFIISMRFSNDALLLFRQKFFSEREARAVMEKVRHGFFTKTIFKLIFVAFTEIFLNL